MIGNVYCTSNSFQLFAQDFLIDEIIFNQENDMSPGDFSLSGFLRCSWIGRMRSRHGRVPQSIRRGYWVIRLQYGRSLRIGGVGGCDGFPPFDIKSEGTALTSLRCDTDLAPLELCKFSRDEKSKP